ncbi:DNA adenine methylase [Acinetobacter pollinis]|uniref:DNA adenine methylase n=1 Tax=Acinetobacter pollinis TaxID=2605270 RepID=UPI002B1BD53E|nr:DNA adenine methylase [Acinetobacter pollinis]
MKKPLMRYHGGKFRLADWVISHFPNHTCYTEVFGGAAGVLLQKPRSYAEVYNDLDGDVVNLFKVLRDKEKCSQLIQQINLTPYAREEFNLAWQLTDDDIEKARRIVVRAQMGFGSAGATKGTTGFRIDTKRAYGTAQSLWSTYPDHLAFVCERLTGVLIENRPAVQVLKDHDASTTLHYVDPPYVFESRYKEASTKGCYKHEMQDEDHIKLIETLLDLEGMVILSGYPNSIYSEMLSGWHRVETSARISAGRGTITKTECLWINPQAQSKDLFWGVA